MKADVIAAMAEIPAVCEHVHLPAQSGSTRILKAMRRTYDRGRYLDLVARLRDAIPDLSLTTDLIVGFPGETRGGLRRDAVASSRSARFDGAYTFLYSPRPGTEAARPHGGRRRRRDEARAHAAARRGRAANGRRERAARFVGTEREVLVEGPSRTDPARLRGRLRQNITVNFAGDAAPGPSRSVAITGSTQHDARRTPDRGLRPVSARSAPGPSSGRRHGSSRCSGRPRRGRARSRTPPPGRSTARSWSPTRSSATAGLEIAADSPRERERREVPYHFVGRPRPHRDLVRRRLCPCGAPRRSTTSSRGAGCRSSPAARGSTCAPRSRTSTFRRTCPSEVRREVERLVADDLDGALAELQRRAPATAARIDTRNPRRVSRALELARIGAGDGRARPAVDRRHPASDAASWGSCARDRSSTG